MHSRNHKFSSWNSQAQPKGPQLAAKPLTAPAQQNSNKPPIEKQPEHETFQQQKFEAYGIQLKARNGPLTAAEQQRLDGLQTQMNNFWTQRLQGAPRFGRSLASMSSHPANVSLPEVRDNGAPGQVVQKKPMDSSVGGSIQTRGHTTGLPNGLRAGVESLSGLPMDDVKVHYNSVKPRQFQALAYTQGADIYVGPGQEKHLPHEAWHVAQQKQGRVKPTRQAKDIAINDDTNLEQEATVMGQKALQMRRLDQVYTTVPVPHLTMSEQWERGDRDSGDCQPEQGMFRPAEVNQNRSSQDVMQRMPQPISDEDYIDLYISSTLEWQLVAKGEKFPNRELYRSKKAPEIEFGYDHSNKQYFALSDKPLLNQLICDFYEFSNDEVNGLLHLSKKMIKSKPDVSVKKKVKETSIQEQASTLLGDPQPQHGLGLDTKMPKGSPLLMAMNKAVKESQFNSIAELEISLAPPSQWLEGMITDENFFRTANQNGFINKTWQQTVDDYLIGKGGLTSSCGQTSDFLLDLVSPSSVEEQRRLAGTGQIGDVLKVMEQYQSMPYYARIGMGGHSFIFENTGTQMTLYQSYFGKQSMAFVMDKLHRQQGTVDKPSNLIKDLRIAFAEKETKESQEMRSRIFYQSQFPTVQSVKYELEFQPEMDVDKLAKAILLAANKYSTEWAKVGNDKTLMKEYFQQSQLQNKPEGKIRRRRLESEMARWRQFDVDGDIASAMGEVC